MCGKGGEGSSTGWERCARVSLGTLCARVCLGVCTRGKGFRLSGASAALTTPFASAASMSFFSDPDPPWKTKKKGLASAGFPSFSARYFWKLPSSSGCSLTLPALYTPCTLPKAAAMVNMGEMGESASQTGGRGRERGGVFRRGEGVCAMVNRERARPRLGQTGRRCGEVFECCG